MDWISVELKIIINKVEIILICIVQIRILNNRIWSKKWKPTQEVTVKIPKKISSWTLILIIYRIYNNKWKDFKEFLSPLSTNLAFNPYLATDTPVNRKDSFPNTKIKMDKVLLVNNNSSKISNNSNRVRVMVIVIGGILLVWKITEMEGESIKLISRLYKISNNCRNRWCLRILLRKIILI